jgi:hypothetical protein
VTRVALGPLELIAGTEDSTASGRLQVQARCWPRSRHEAQDDVDRLLPSFLFA